MLMLLADYSVAAYVMTIEGMLFGNNQINEVLIDLMNALLMLRSRLTMCRPKSLHVSLLHEWLLGGEYLHDGLLDWLWA